MSGPRRRPPRPAAAGPRTLIVVRHGRAEKGDGGDDYGRPLTLHGRRDVHRLGEWLARKGLQPDFIVASPSLRTEETVEVLLRAWGREEEEGDDDAVAWDERVYEATLEDLLEVLADVPPDHRRVLLAGHNPGLTDLVEHLAPERPALSATGRVLTPGSAAVLRMPDFWQDLPRHGATLENLVRPGEV